jgi:hypothetical protein
MDVLHLLRTWTKNTLFNSSAMTLNYESEGEPLQKGVRRQHQAISPGASNRGTW